MTWVFLRPITSPRGKKKENDFLLCLLLILLNVLSKCFDKQLLSSSHIDAIVALLDSILENRLGTSLPLNRVYSGYSKSYRSQSMIGFATSLKSSVNITEYIYGLQLNHFKNLRKPVWGITPIVSLKTIKNWLL